MKQLIKVDSNIISFCSFNDVRGRVVVFAYQSDEFIIMTHVNLRLATSMILRAVPDRRRFDPTLVPECVVLVIQTSFLPERNHLDF